jgi:RimJ/RimL family protein N-acetyltransferase
MPARWPIARRLESERLILEPLRLDHADEMLAVLSGPELYKHIGGEPPSMAEVRERYARQATGSSPNGRYGWLNWVLRRRDDTRLVGFVQVTLSGDGAAPSAELAWLIGTDFQGEGLASESAGAVADWLPSVGVGQLTAHIHPDNVASAAVARRIGLMATTDTKDGEIRWAGQAGVAR